MTHTLNVTSPWGGREGANMIYIKPSIQAEEAQVAQMLAESLAIDNNTTVDGADALTRDTAWSIWNDDDTSEK